MTNPPGFYERELYRAAGAEAVWRDPRPVHSMSPSDIVNVATDAAVKKDRERMAEVIRTRTINAQATGMPPRLAMMVDELMFQVADQVQEGLIREGGVNIVSPSNDHPNPSE